MLALSEALRKHSRRIRKEEELEMAGMKRRLAYCAETAGVVVAGLYMFSIPVYAQNAPAQGAKPPAETAPSAAKNKKKKPEGVPIAVPCDNSRDLDACPPISAISVSTAACTGM